MLELSLFSGGACYRQPLWDSATGVIVYGLLPTPVKADGHGFHRVTYDSSLRRWLSRGARRNLQIHWAQFAVLSKKLSRGIARPQFAEAMMGWPIGWSDLRPLEMDRYRQWLEQYGKDSV